MNLLQSVKIGRLITFNLPRRISFGIGAVERVAEEVVPLGAGKVLVVTDNGVEKAGLVDRVLEPLKSKKLAVTVYSQIASEPTLKSVGAAVEYGRSGEYDVVIGVGGGSVMDTAKLVAGLITNEGEPIQFLNPAVDNFKKPTLPKILIPTTSGTGSECSGGAVVIDTSTGYKLWAASSAIIAEVALVDPSMTLTLPPQQTAACAMDALSHAVEALILRVAHPVSDAYAFEATKLIFSNVSEAYHHGDSLEARWAMSLASMLAGIVIVFPWVGGPATMGHCTAEAWGPAYNIPHGVACGVALPYTLQYNLPACGKKMVDIASAMGQDVTGLSTRQGSFKAVEAVMQLLKDLELPANLQDLGVPVEDLTTLVKHIVEDRQYLYELPTSQPRRLTVENVTKFFKNMWYGNIGLDYI